MGVLNFSSKRGQNEIHSDFAEREKIQGLKNLNVPNSGNAPKLRFPEFSEDWSYVSLESLAPNISAGKDSSEDGKYNLYGSTGIIGKTKTPTYKGEIVLVARVGANAGLLQYVNDEFGVTDNTLVVNAHENNKYIYYYLQFYNLNRLVFGSGQPLITGGMLKKIPIGISIGSSEKNKVVELLSLIDERIGTQNKIIQQLQSLIKGIVVSVTAETPNTRIDKCLACHSSTLQENQIEECGDFPVYGANGICGYTVNADFNEPAILIVKDGSGVGNVRFVNGKYSVIGTQNILTSENRFFLKYIFYCLQAFNFVPYKTGMAIPHIYFKDYGKAKIYCPNFEQQVKNASQIDLIESKIEIETQLLNKYEEQKKFLLSNMFI